MIHPLPPGAIGRLSPALRPRRRINGVATMKEKRIKVWLLHLKGRDCIYVQWKDPLTGRLKTKSTGTENEKEAEAKRSDLESDLNHGRFSEPSKTTWADFRDAFEHEKVGAMKYNSQVKVNYVLDTFEKLAAPSTIGEITERTFSVYAAKLRGRRMSPATVRGHLAYLRAVLRWAMKQNFLTSVPAIEMPKVPKGTNKAKVRAAANIGTEAFERLLM